MLKGVSEIRRMPRLGKIHLGKKKMSEKGKEYPSATKFFVVTPEVSKVYGEEPTELDVMLPTEDVEVVFPQFYKRYSNSRGLLCRSDGVVATQFDENGIGTQIPCDIKTCEFYVKEKPECKAIGSLMVVLPKVEGFGVYQIDTGSLTNIINVNSEMELIRNLLGRISGIPLKLTREVQEMQVKGKKMKVALIHLRSPYSLNQLMEARTSLPPTAQVTIENKEEAPDLIDDEAILEEETKGPKEEVEETEPEEPKVKLSDSKELIKEIYKLLTSRGHTTISNVITLLEKALPEHSWKKIDNKVFQKMSVENLQKVLDFLNEEDAVYLTPTKEEVKE